VAPYSKIVTGTDGSEAACDAITVTGVIAAATGIPVAVVTAWKSSVAVPGGREQPWADLTARGADVDLTAMGVMTIEQFPLQGNAFDALVGIANRSSHALIVVGAAGLDQTSSRLLGSTSNQLSHNSPVDVLFVRRPVQKFASVALATDGSPTSLRAVRAGADLAAAVGARPVLVTAAGDTASGTATLTDVADQLDTAELEHRILLGSPADALISTADNYDLLVIGNRGMSGFARVLGSTANTITQRATSNLLLVNTAPAAG
jgi:nucleotide-binding universal stress UspA family protein